MQVESSVTHFSRSGVQVDRNTVDLLKYAPSRRMTAAYYHQAAGSTLAPLPHFCARQVPYLASDRPDAIEVAQDWAAERAAKRVKHAQQAAGSLQAQPSVNGPARAGNSNSSSIHAGSGAEGMTRDPRLASSAGQANLSFGNSDANLHPPVPKKPRGRPPKPRSEGDEGDEVAFKKRRVMSGTQRATEVTAPGNRPSLASSQPSHAAAEMAARRSGQDQAHDPGAERDDDDEHDAVFEEDALAADAAASYEEAQQAAAEAAEAAAVLDKEARKHEKRAAFGQTTLDHHNRRMGSLDLDTGGRDGAGGSQANPGASPENEAMEDLMLYLRKLEQAAASEDGDCASTCSQGPGGSDADTAVITENYAAQDDAAYPPTEVLDAGRAELADDTASSRPPAGASAAVLAAPGDDAAQHAPEEGHRTMSSSASGRTMDLHAASLPAAHPSSQRKACTTAAQHDGQHSGYLELRAGVVSSPSPHTSDLAFGANRPSAQVEVAPQQSPPCGSLPAASTSHATPPAAAAGEASTERAAPVEGCEADESPAAAVAAPLAEPAAAEAAVFRHPVGPVSGIGAPLAGQPTDAYLGFELVKFGNMCFGTAITAHDFASASGQTYAGQLRQVLEAVDRRLMAVGSSKRQLLKVTIMLVDRVGLNEVLHCWTEWGANQHLPAPSFSQGIPLVAGCADARVLLSVDVVAACTPGPVAEITPL
ncbi:hypothetical protein WJX72_007520 [[Myrmecia] bisecta]|uniref:Uncharacterized protein n=1 Tax=[Myrmecia] bisecta TaxID=41462 RepID=A0AAW1QFM4_9CHLO